LGAGDIVFNYIGSCISNRAVELAFAPEVSLSEDVAEPLALTRV